MYHLSKVIKPSKKNTVKKKKWIEDLKLTPF